MIKIIPISIVLLILLSNISNADILDAPMINRLKYSPSKAARIKSTLESRANTIKTPPQTRSAKRLLEKKMKRKLDLGEITKEEYEAFINGVYYAKPEVPADMISESETDQTLTESQTAENEIPDQSSSEKESQFFLKKEIIPIVNANKALTSPKIKDGLIKKYYSSGAIYSEEIFVNGKKDGLCKYFNRDGTLKKEITFANDKEVSVKN